MRFRGRLKEMIKTGGVNVAPLEVEHVLLQHPDIVQAHVVGVPDRLKGEIVAAAVEMRADAEPDAAAITAFCRERLASYKVPTRLAFRAAGEFPRTPTGKIHKPGLRQELAQEPALIGPQQTARHREERMPGLYYDQFHVGQVFKHPIRRTITEADNVWFSAVTHNPSYLHLDEEYCRNETEFGQRLVNSCFTLALMVGISVGDTVLGTAVANLGWDEVRFPKPLFHGDTVRVESEVLEMRESKSRPGDGIVIFAHRAFNQNGELVAHCKRSSLMKKTPA